MRKHAGAAAFFVLTSVVMTWPLARTIDRAVSDPGDPFINIWILDWDHHATFTSPLSLFHANAFYPARYSLAFSENLYGIAVLLMPLRLAGIEPIPAYNIALLAGLALCGFGAYLLGYRLTGSFVAAIAAGVFYAYVPFRFTHLAHLQHIWGGWMPLLLAALIAYIDRPGWRQAAAFAAVFLWNGLTNVHWFMFGTFATAASAGLFYAAGVRRWKELVVCTGVALALLAPFMYPYAAAADLYGMTRSREETRRFSALLSDWGVSAPHARLHRHLADASVDPERWLFPGFLGIALGVAGVFAVARYPRPVVLGVLWIVLGVAGSLGLNFFFHEFLFDALPGFRAIRVPARWAAIAYIGMSMLIAVTTSTLARRHKWAGVAVPVLLIAELFGAPIRWYMASPDPPPVYRWLASEAAGGPIVELPINYASSEYRYLLRATEHHRPLVNGVSGLTPPFTATLMELSKSNPIPQSFVSALRRIGCELVIVHADALGEYGPATREWLRREIEEERLRFVRRFDAGVGGDWVFLLSPPGDGHITTELQAFLDGRWTRNEDTFGLMEPPPHVVRGGILFSGFALSPYGVRAVDLLFENGGVRVPTVLIEEPALHEVMPWYPATTRPRFVAHMPSRPADVRRRTDVQAEVTDGRGKKTRLENMWFTWE